MLRFFRQIRKKLMEQNKVRTYLLYAIGEIALVMIGILLALQVNNWNEKTNQTQTAQYHLEILKQNLEDDKEQLQDLLHNAYDRERMALNMSDIIQLKTEPNDSIAGNIAQLLLEFNFKPRTNGIDLLISSGSLDALNSDIQNSISKYYLSTEAILEREEISNRFIHQYETFVFDKYSHIWGKGNTNDMFIPLYKDDQRPPISFDLEYFLSDKTMEAYIFARLYQIRKQIDTYDQGLLMLEELSRKI